MKKIRNHSRRRASRGGTLAFVDPARLKYYIHDHVGSFRLQLLGVLTAADLTELDGCWRTAMSSVAGRRIQIDLRLLLNVDASGLAWLAGMASTKDVEFLCGPQSVAFVPVGAAVETGSDNPHAVGKRDNLIAKIATFFGSRQPPPAESQAAGSGTLALELQGQNTEVHAS